jgi:hypothetical protein
MKINALERMIHKQFMYRSKHITIRDYFKIENEEVLQIVAEPDNFRLAISDLNDFLKQCLPVEDEEDLKGKLTIVNTSNQLSPIQKILMDNIRRVQNDKDYINQAQTINKSVNALISTVNAQINLQKALKEK